jgi:predicted transposase YbfD/YdcC
MGMIRPINKESKDKEKKDTSIVGHFAELPDPRIDRTKRHKLVDIITIAICSTLSLGEIWDAMEEFGQAHEQWLREFLELPNGIPSHDTFNRVFSHIDPDEFRTCFISWVKSLEPTFDGEIIAVDGKTVRGSRDKSNENKAIHMVSAWACHSSLVLGQLKTEEKSNEITAIPKLLDLLEIKGCVVSIDAMGCQKKIAAKIVEKHGDWVLSLKGNQSTFHQDVIAHFDSLNLDELHKNPRVFLQTQDKGHGRLETRRYYYLTDHSLTDYAQRWKGFKGIGMVESIRDDGKKVTTERRYFIASLQGDVKAFAKAVRSHWGIENSLHWVLDVSFSEDANRTRKGNRPENYSILRHIALNMLRQDTTSKKSIKLKRLRAGWDTAYLEQLLDGLQAA